MIGSCLNSWGSSSATSVSATGARDPVSPTGVSEPAEREEVPEELPGLTEEGVEGIVSSSTGSVDWRLPVRLETMLEAKGFPPGISTLDVSVADVDVEGVDGILSSSTGFVDWRLHVSSNTVLEA